MALATYKVLVDLTKDPRSGVSMIELRQYCRPAKFNSRFGLPPFHLTKWRNLLLFSPQFSINVPLMDTTIYLDYLADRFRKSGAHHESVRFEKLEDVEPQFDLVNQLRRNRRTRTGARSRS